MTKQKILMGLVSAVAVLSFSTPGLAQDKPTWGEGVAERLSKKEEIDYKAKGAKVGNFTVFPKVSVIEEYNDNVFAASSDVKDDFITTVNPTVKVNSDFSNHALNFNAGVKAIRHMTHDSDDVENYDVGVSGKVDVTRTVKVKLGATYKLGHEDRSDPDAVNGISPTENDTTGVSASVSFTPGKLSMLVSASLDKKDYDDARTTTGITNNDDRDRDEFKANARVGFEYLPDTEVFVQADYSDMSYDSEAATDDNGEDRDAKGYALVLGTGLDFTGITTGEVFAGYQKHETEDSALPDASSYRVGAGLKSKFTKLTSGRLNIGRVMNETTSSGIDSLTASNVTVRINHKFRRNFFGRIKGKASLTEYNGSGRKDYAYTGNTGVRYLFNRNFAMGLEYEYKAKDSNTAGNDWTNNKIRIDLGIQF